MAMNRAWNDSGAIGRGLGIITPNKNGDSGTGSCGYGSKFSGHGINANVANEDKENENGIPLGPIPSSKAKTMLAEAKANTSQPKVHHSQQFSPLLNVQNILNRPLESSENGNSKAPLPLPPVTYSQDLAIRMKNLLELREHALLKTFEEVTKDYNNDADDDFEKVKAIYLDGLDLDPANPTDEDMKSFLDLGTLEDLDVDDPNFQPSVSDLIDVFEVGDFLLLV